ncbi:hypothetical protein [Actinophytocola sediminis]
MDDQPYDDRHDNPRWTERYYPEHSAPAPVGPLPAHDRIPARCPDTIPRWMTDQP